MENIKGFAIELDLDHLSVDRGLKGLKDNLKTVNSEMKRNMSAFDYGEKSVKKYETSLNGLNKKLQVQKVAVAEAKKEYERMVEEYGRGSKEAEKAAREYNNQAASLNNLERYISKTTAELERFKKEQKIANSMFTKFGDGLIDTGGHLKNIGGKIEGVGSQLTNKITKPATVATTAAAALVATLGFKRLIGMDVAQAKLKGMGYEGKELDKVMKNVKESVQGTTMTAAEGADVAAGAMAAGVKQGKDLQKYIRLVGSAANGANKPVADMAMIFNRVQGAGKLMTRELNMIELSMPGFSKAMAKHLGVSSEKLSKMVKDGKVSSNDFLKVMDSFAGKMAEEYAKTWDGLVSNTKANIGIIGETFLRGVFKESKKSLADFIEMLKDPAIQKKAEEMGEKAREAFIKMRDSIENTVDWYKNLDDGQKELIKKLGITVVAAGPVLQVFGKMTSGLGSVFEFTGKVSKAIGVARGAGLAAGLASLGPGAVAGLAIAGLTGVGLAAYALHKKNKSLEEVNLDVANSLVEQTQVMESSIGTFEKLAKKSELSNYELAELYRINKKINNSNSSDEIERLQKSYDELAKKSGLSKKEIDKLFKANESIIEQSPNVGTVINDEGDAWVLNTQKVRDNIDAKYEQIQIELNREREKQLKNEAELQQELTDLQKEYSTETLRLEYFEKARNMTLDEMKKKKEKLQENDDRSVAQNIELHALTSAINNDADKMYFKQLDVLDATAENVRKKQEEIDKNNQITEQLANTYLAAAGITKTGEKGLKQLDEKLAKNEEEMAQYDELLAKGGKLTEKEQERYDALYEQNEKLQEAKGYINEELEMYASLNSRANDVVSTLGEEEQKRLDIFTKMIDIDAKEGNIVQKIEKKNNKLDESIAKAEKEFEKGSLTRKEFEKQVTELEDKKQKNNAILEQVLKELGIWDDLDQSIKDSITSLKNKNSEQDKNNKKAEDGKNKEKETKAQVDATTDAKKKAGQQTDANNKKTDAGVKKEQARSKEAGRDVNKNVTAKDNGTVAAIDKGATAPKSKRVSLFQSGLNILNRQAEAGKRKKVSLYQVGLSAINIAASNPVTKVVNFVGKGLSNLKFWEKGTPRSGHPGGPAIIGEKGSELVTLPSGRSFLSPNSHTLLDLPKSTHVMPNKETKRLINNLPKYADGTEGWSNYFGNSELAKMLSLYNESSESNVVVTSKDTNKENPTIKILIEQNEQLRKTNELLTAILGKDLDLYKLNKKVDEGLNNISNRKKAAWGGN